MKQTHGGKRKGSGRKKGEPTKVISFRVKLVRVAELVRRINKLIKE